MKTYLAKEVVIFFSSLYSRHLDNEMKNLNNSFVLRRKNFPTSLAIWKTWINSSFICGTKFGLMFTLYKNEFFHLLMNFQYFLLRNSLDVQDITATFWEKFKIFIISFTWAEWRLFLRIKLSIWYMLF